MDEEKLTDLAEVLELEARAAGVETDGWTRKGVVQVIKQRYGVKHHRSHISRILAKIGFTRQKIQGKHYRKDEEATQVWREESLPELKKKRRWKVIALFMWMKPAFRFQVHSVINMPGLVGASETKINLGITDRIFLASSISATGDSIYKIRSKPFDGAAIVALLKQMLWQLSGKLLIVWDNASIHDCQETRRFLANDKQAERLHLAKQPTYSPEAGAFTRTRRAA